VNFYITQAKLLYLTVPLQELTFKNYRHLVKSLLDPSIPFKSLYKNFNNIIKTTTGLTDNEINNLCYTDYLILLLYVRAFSIGDSVPLIIENEKEEQLNVNLSIEKTIQSLYRQTSKLYNKILKYNNIIITLQIPTIHDIINFKENVLFSFIKQIQINKQKINFSTLSNENKNKIIETLPINIFVSLKKQIQKYVSILNKLNIFKHLPKQHLNKKFPIPPNKEAIFFLLKLIFNMNLDSMYNHIFILTKAGNFSSAYLDKCSPGEVFLYMSKLEESFAHKQETNSKTKNNISPNTDNDDLFNDLPPINEESPNATF